MSCVQISEWGWGGGKEEPVEVSLGKDRGSDLSLDQCEDSGLSQQTDMSQGSGPSRKGI